MSKLLPVMLVGIALWAVIISVASAVLAGLV